MADSSERPGASLALRRGTGRAPAAVRSAALACAVAAAALGAAGCAAARAGTARPIQVATAYVQAPTTPGTTVGYVVIRNNGPADRLLSVRSSAGGRVALRVPVRAGSASLRTVPAIAVPAHSTLSMVPDGDQLMITGAGPMRGGRNIRLTLVFAHAGAVPVLAEVTNPQTGGSSYFLN